MKCIECGSDKHIVNYENGYYDCEKCNLHFFAKKLKNSNKKID